MGVSDQCKAEKLSFSLQFEIRLFKVDTQCYKESCFVWLLSQVWWKENAEGEFQSNKSTCCLIYIGKS